MSVLQALICLIGICLMVEPPGPDAPSDPPARALMSDTARLKELLYQRDRPQEQSQAAMVLVQAGTIEAQAAVREGLRRHDRPDVFQALAAAVRLWRDERFIPPLLQGLNSDSLTIRQAAMEALAAQEPKTITRWMVGMAEDSGASLHARQAAVGVLGRAQHKPAMLALLKLMQNDSTAIRQAAATSLQEISGQSLGLDASAWQSWWQPYKDMSDESWLVSRTALLTDRSRRLNDELQRTETALLTAQQLLYSKVPPTDRLTFLQAMAQSEFPVLRSQTVQWIGDALKESAGPELKAQTDLLLQLSRDGNEGVQRQAVLTLEKADDPSVIDRLLDLLASGTPQIRSAAARSLARFGGAKSNGSGNPQARILAALEKALGDSALPVVASAAESLGMLKATQSGALLAALLRHYDDTVRQAAARALENVATQSIADSIYQALDDSPAQVRFSLVGAIGQIGTREKLSDEQFANLIRRLGLLLVQDTDPGVRSRAATVLGDLGGPAELTLLWQRVRAKEDNRVQLKAWSAMIDILVRAQSAPLLGQWDQTLTELNENPRRVQLFQAVRDRWLKLDGSKAPLEVASAGLVRALLAERKWQQAAPLAVEMVRKAQAEPDRRERLRWILVACSQGVDERKPQEVLRLLKEVEELLIDAKDLGAEFADVKRRAQQLQNGVTEPAAPPNGPIK